MVLETVTDEMNLIIDPDIPPAIDRIIRAKGEFQVIQTQPNGGRLQTKFRQAFQGSGKTLQAGGPAEPQELFYASCIGGCASQQPGAVVPGEQDLPA